MKLSPYLTVRVRFELAYSSGMRSESVDSWLRHILKSDSAGSSKLPGEYIDNPCASYLSRVLDLGRLVLELWKIPIFEPASIEKILPNLARANSFKCVIIQPTVEAIPMEAYENAYLIASELCHWCCNNDIAKSELSDFLAMFEQRVKKNGPPFGLGGGSTIPVLRVAHKLNIPFFHLGQGIYQLGTGSKSRYLDRSHSEGDGFIGVALSAHKAMSARILKQHGLPTPLHLPVFTREAAMAAAKTIGYPVVVKPVDANRGEGVTVGVDSADVLYLAFDQAKKRSRSGEVLIERQVPGVCHRLFIIKDRLLYAVKRLPLFVTGDGVQTVHQIISAEIASDQARPYWLRNKMARFDEAAFAALGIRGTDCHSVPKPGERIFLRPLETTQWGGIDEDVTNAVHPQNLKAAVEAAKAFDLEVAGVDMISTDISVPWTDNGAIVNEVNGGPLLGGGEISRSHIETFLQIYLDGGGLIPVTEAAPDETVPALLQRQAALLQKGIRSSIVFADVVVGPYGQRLYAEEIAVSHPSGRLVEVLTAQSTRLLHSVLQNRTVDHVLLTREYAPL